MPPKWASLTTSCGWWGRALRASPTACRSIALLKFLQRYRPSAASPGLSISVSLSLPLAPRARRRSSGTNRVPVTSQVLQESAAVAGKVTPFRLERSTPVLYPGVDGLFFDQSGEGLLGRLISRIRSSSPATDTILSKILTASAPSGASERRTYAAAPLGNRNVGVPKIPCSLTAG